MSLLTTMYAPSPAQDRLISLRGGLRARFDAWKVYRKTFAELNALSDRELTDLGLGRTDIRRVARDAAYGG